MIGLNIKVLREDKGWTQADLVEKSKEFGGNFNQVQVSMWEKDKRVPSESNIKVLCKIFDCKEEDILKDDYDLEKAEIYKEAFEYGKKFTQDELRDMFVEASEFEETPDKSEYLVREIVKLSIKKNMVIPELLAKLRDDMYLYDEVAFYNFYIGMWNGSHENN